MNSAVCTLFEGDYHYGVGALVNSLYKHGFRGVVWAGYRGALPPWAKNVQQHSLYQEFAVAEGCCIRFVPVATKLHFTNYKPTFMLDLWENYCPNAEELFYFDPDIVIKCRWSFFEGWARYGVALCQEITFGYMPSDHPLRFALSEFAKSRGYECPRQLNQYFNAGFVGFNRQCKSALTLWKDILNSTQDIGINLTQFGAGDCTQLFNQPDQDALNLTAMVTDCPLSTIGPEGMDFIPGGFTMSHAVGGTKPWRKRMIQEASQGKAPTRADKEFWKNTEEPILLYSKHTARRKWVDLRYGSAIGRFVGRR